MGFFNEIHRCWITIDNELYLWDYDSNDISCYDGLKSNIISVGIALPKKNLFLSKIKVFI